MEAVKAHSIPKHTRGAAGPTGPRIDEKTPTALSPSPSTFHYCFSDQACDHILPILPHTLFLRHAPRRPLWKIQSQPTESCLWCMQKQPLAMKSLAWPREASPAKPSRQRWGSEVRCRSRARLLCINSGMERDDPSPALGANTLTGLSCWITGKFLSYPEVQLTSTLLLRLSEKRGKGYSTEVVGQINPVVS